MERIENNLWLMMDCASFSFLFREGIRADTTSASDISRECYACHIDFMCIAAPAKHKASCLQREFAFAMHASFA